MAENIQIRPKAIIMKHSILTAFIVLVFLTGCKKDDNGTSAGGPGTGRLTLLKGNNQSGIFGELLGDTIKINFASADPEDRFRITYALIQGNGMVEYPGDYQFNFFLADKPGTANLLWRMGCDFNTQKIRFYVYAYNPHKALNFSNTPSDSVTISASAVKPNGWCRACGYGKVDVYAPRIITPDNVNLYLINNGLFKSTDGGLNWYKVKGVPYSDELVNAQFNSNHWLYVLTRKHGIYYSKDMVQWTEINNGILDMRDPTGFLVEDTAMFVSFYFDGPYRTTDNGGFWRKLVVGGGSQRFQLFKRHPSGKLYLVDDWSDVKVSANNGDNWSLVNGNGLPMIYDLAINQQGLIYIGADDATIIESDPATGAGSTHTYYQWNGSAQNINNITFSPTDVYYLVNFTPVPGIYSKNNNWGRIDIGFNDRIEYYYRKNNGNFLVVSKSWFYCKD